MNNKELQIRLLPMSKDEFKNKTALEVQKEYFLDILINEQDGRFFYPGDGMNTTEGSLILFQYDNSVIAAAIFEDRKDFTNNPVEGKYDKANVLDKNSVSVFEPITKTELKSVVKNFKSFNQSKQFIDYKYINEIMDLIDKKSMLWEEYNKITSNTKHHGTEGAVTWGMQKKYERDPKARSECIKHYGAICKVCGFDFEKVYGEMGKGFIHVHHITKLASINCSYTVDPVKDLIPLCPNCHAMIHNTYYGKELTIQELKEKLENNKESINV